MISEFAYMFLIGLAFVLFVAGFLTARDHEKLGGVLTFFSCSLFIINAIMSGNVGAPDGSVLYAGYTVFGPIMLAFAIVALVSAFIMFLEVP